MYARAIGSTSFGEAEHSTDYGLSSGAITPCTTASFSPSTSSPATIGTTVVFTPSSSCGGSAAQYKWYVRVPGGTPWNLAQDWGTGTFSWNTTGDRKSTRLNSSHTGTSYAVFCVKEEHSTEYG